MTLTAILPISAKRGEGLEDLLTVLAGFLPEGPALFPLGWSPTSRSGRSAGRFCGEACSTAWIREIPPRHRRGDHKIFRAGEWDD